MGPLKGLRVIELAGIGPGPFAGMLLADMGAEVICVERKTDPSQLRKTECNLRGKKSIALNLKSSEGVETLLKLIERADVLFEGFRPGVTERLGLGPDVCLRRNPRLVYGRMTGWGQTGPLSHAAGHDINYISLTGALYAMGRRGQRPPPPLNLVGDFGGGSMFLLVGLLAALLEVQKTGEGQVIDAAMTEGTANLMAMFNSMHARGGWSTDRESNLLDGAAHFYDTYETADGKYISIGSIEPQFYALLIEKTGVDPQRFADQRNPANWEALKAELTEVFKSKTRDEWCELMEGSDICFAPVLDFIEAQSHPHNAERDAYIRVDEMIQPAPAPRFSRTPSEVQHGAHYSGEDTRSVLAAWGFDEQQIDELEQKGALA